MIGSPYPPEIVVTAVKYSHAFVIRVEFADGWARDVDLAGELEGEVFLPLRDPEFFKQVRFDDETGTAVWPNGADFAPEFLRWGPHLPTGCPCGYEDASANAHTAAAGST